jgi:hypothetical protein
MKRFLILCLSALGYFAPHALAETPSISRFIGSKLSQSFEYDGIEASVEFIISPPRAKDEEPPQEVAALISQYRGLDTQCRGGRSNDPNTQSACTERDSSTLMDQVRALGYCYGRKNDLGSDMRWSRCGSDSIDYKDGSENLRLVCSNEGAEIWLELAPFQTVSQGSSRGTIGAGGEEAKTEYTSTVVGKKVSALYEVSGSLKPVLKAMHQGQTLHLPLGAMELRLPLPINNEQTKRALGAMFQACP